MRNIPTRFNPKVLFLEDISDLDNLTKDELYGIIIAYEIRIEPKNVSRKEATFKETWNPKFNKSECKNTTDILDEEETNCVRRLKRGQGKYT